MINLNEVKPGDVFSEQSCFVFLNKEGSDTYNMKHLSTGETVKLSGTYVQDMLQTADQYEKEQKIGLENKYWTKAQLTASQGSVDPLIREGDLKIIGMRTVWNTVSSQVFTAIFRKKDTVLSNKAYNTKVQEVVTKALADIESAKVGKKGVAKTAAQVLEEVIKNPVLQVEQGEIRVLRGIKQQWESSTGFFDVLDIDLNEKRQVNINTLEALIVDGVKWVRE